MKDPIARKIQVHDLLGRQATSQRDALSGLPVYHAKVPVCHLLLTPL